jgi:hypothetical protein
VHAGNAVGGACVILGRVDGGTLRNVGGRYYFGHGQR